MNSPSPIDQPTHARASTPSIDEVRFLARRRRYTEAALCLAETLAAGACSKTEALDLQARIYAQQGMLLHAESCWRQAAAEDPSNPLYGAAIERIREKTNSASPVWILMLQVVRLLLLVVLVGLCIGVWRETALQQANTPIEIEDLRTRAEQSSSRVEKKLAGIFDQMRGLASTEMVVEATAQGKEGMAEMQRQLLDQIEVQQSMLAGSIASTQNAIGEIANTTAEQQIRMVSECWQESAQFDGQNRLVRDLGAQMEQMRLADKAQLESLLGMSKTNEKAIAGIRNDIDRIGVLLMRQASDRSNGSEPSASDYFDSTLQPNEPRFEQSGGIVR